MHVPAAGLLLLGQALQAQVAVLAPVRAPGVLQVPVPDPVLHAVAEEHDRVLQDVLGVAVRRPQDAARVEVPRAAGGDRDGQGPLLQQALDDGCLPVLRQLRPAGHAHAAGPSGQDRAQRVHLAAVRALHAVQRRLQQRRVRQHGLRADQALVVVPVEGRVAEEPLRGEADVHGVVEGQRGGGALAAALAAAVPGVRRAGDEGLRGERGHRLLAAGAPELGGDAGQHVRVALHVALEHGDGGLGPAGAAGALVPDDGHQAGSVLHEAEGGGDLLLLAAEEVQDQRVARGREARAAAPVAQHGLELLLALVHELGDALRPGLGRPRVEADELLLVLLEDLLTLCPLLGPRLVAAAELLHEFLEGELLQVLQGGSRGGVR
mmetsp:Transcript_2994/g.9380  ORF Transcript_2994/g.9380 Transcript_2994/m.9380 type:complete len:378 (+) Transcript_2994:186-1319(+)